jgi:hypothetical protein
MNDLYKENYKPLKKEIKDLNIRPETLKLV